MHLSLLLPLFGAVAFAIYKILSIAIVSRQNAGNHVPSPGYCPIEHVAEKTTSVPGIIANVCVCPVKARLLGCEDAPLKPDCGFLGLKHVRRMQAADAEMLFLDYILEVQELMNNLTGRVCSTFKTNVLGQYIYVTNDPKNIQAMLATQFDDFALGPTRFDIMGPVLGDGIVRLIWPCRHWYTKLLTQVLVQFVQDGKKWEHSRAMLRPNFVRDQVSDLEMEERHVQNLMKVMPVQADGWTAMTNIQQLFFRFTIDSATEFLFGDSCDSQLSEATTELSRGSVPSKQHNERAFSWNFDTAQGHMSKKFRYGDQHWLHNPREYKENGRVVNEFVKHYVDLALQKSAITLNEKTTNAKKEKYVFLEALAQQTQDPVELRAQMLNILLAGRDTTASLLSWTFQELLRHPAVFDKLRATVIASFGTYERPTDISFSSLKSCQYLQAVLNESLRLWSVVPGNGRRTIRATTLPRGGGRDGQSPVFLPAGTQVDYSIHVMHRRKDLWGPDAAEFNPERFIGRKQGWEFLPFNGGPRICIGQQFALTEASYVVVRLLQRFDRIEAKPGDVEARPTSFLTLTSCPGRPVTLKLHEAK